VLRRGGRGCRTWGWGEGFPTSRGVDGGQVGEVLSVTPGREGVKGVGLCPGRLPIGFQTEIVKDFLQDRTLGCGSGGPN